MYIRSRTDIDNEICEGFRENKYKFDKLYEIRKLFVKMSPSCYII